MRVDRLAGILPAMSIVKRTAMLQIRVTPAIKRASEAILRRIGLNMTEAVELFLRRMIVDQKPFEVVAIGDATYVGLLADAETSAKKARGRPNARSGSSATSKRQRMKPKGG